MSRWMPSSLTTVMMAAVVAAVAEPDAATIFYSDTVLGKAVEDIAKMQEPELRAFTHYLAECQGETDPATRHACAAAQTTYEIEFGGKRALDDMMDARSMLLERDLLIPNPDANDPRKLADTAIKVAKILEALQRATRERFRALKARGEPPPAR